MWATPTNVRTLISKTVVLRLFFALATLALDILFVEILRRIAPQNDRMGAPQANGVKGIISLLGAGRGVLLGVGNAHECSDLLSKTVFCVLFCVSKHWRKPFGFMRSFDFAQDDRERGFLE